jgi:hypothetical protein
MTIAGKAADSGVRLKLGDCFAASASTGSN